MTSITVCNGIRIDLNLPDELISPEFLPFEGWSDDPDPIVVELGDSSLLADVPDDSFELYDSEWCLTCIGHNCIYSLLHRSPGWLGMVVEEGRIVCVPSASMIPSLQEARDLFEILFGGVCLQLRKRGVFVLHSASLVDAGKVFAFSALSGTGKTTHVELWRRLYDVPFFNGDVLAVRATDAVPTAYGIPWSGSSGRTTVGSLPLGGIFFLERGDENRIEEIPALMKTLSLTQRMVSVNYNHTAFIENTRLLEGFASHLHCARLICRPDEAAAQLSHEYVHTKMLS